MDTITAPTPPAASWWRRPLADLLDVLVVALGGLLVGGAVFAAMLAGSTDDPWAELAAGLLGIGAGLVAALAAWVGVLVLAARRAMTPGSRAVGLGVTRVRSMAGRHVAVVVVLWAAAGAVAATTEPWPAGPLGGAVAAAVATGVALAAWGRGPLRTRLQVVGVAAVVGLLVAGAVPDRAPYPWELRRQAETAMVAALEEDPAAARMCGERVGAVGLRADHATTGCDDPDRAWRVEGRRGTVADMLLAAVRETVGGDAQTGLRHGEGDLRITVDGSTVAIVRHDGDCAVEAIIDGYVSPLTDPDRIRCP